MALVSNIQKCCVHDGPGLRTVLFLMGCPLRCKWCQNPENLAARPVALFDAAKCVSCGRCLPMCTHAGSVLDAAGLRIDRGRCVGCGECIDACCTEAKTLCGREMTADEAFEAVMRDEIFYRRSGGGVTVSGGEPTMHAAFCRELFAKLHVAGIHTAMETCGWCAPETMREAAAETDLFLFDLKAVSPEVHREWTGRDNAPILRNLAFLLAGGKRVIIRIPLIPGVNTGAEFERMMAYLAGLPAVREVHILPFHQAGQSKYMLSGTPYALADMEECTEEIAQAHAEIARGYGFTVNVGGWDAVI